MLPRTPHKAHEPEMAAHGKIARREEIAREKEREREREGPQALTGKGERSGGMGADSCPQERFLGAFMRQKATFPSIL